MDDEFRLVFRGEVDEGQHPAVVQKRLATLLRLDDDKVAQLFSGSAVVLRRSVDRTTAAQFQAAFKKAGAKLRVQPIRYEPTEESADSATPKAAAERSADFPTESAAESAQVPVADAQGLQLLPVGSLLLEVHERLPPVENNVPTSHLELDELSALDASGSEVAPEAPVNVDHISIAEVGAQLGSESAAPEAPLDIAVSFEFSEDGSWLHDDQEDAVAPIDAPDFSLAEPGANLIETREDHAAIDPAPDVSHLSLQDVDPDA